MGSLTKEDIQINIDITIPVNVLSKKGKFLAYESIEKVIKIFGDELKEKIINLLKDVE
jgi:hypothetical protein